VLTETKSFTGWWSVPLYWYTSFKTTCMQHHYLWKFLEISIISVTSAFPWVDNLNDSYPSHNVLIFKPKPVIFSAEHQLHHQQCLPHKNYWYKAVHDIITLFQLFKIPPSWPNRRHCNFKFGDPFFFGIFLLHFIYKASPVRCIDIKIKETTVRFLSLWEMSFLSVNKTVCKPLRYQYERQWNSFLVY